MMKLELFLVVCLVFFGARGQEIEGVKFKEILSYLETKEKGDEVLFEEMSKGPMNGFYKMDFFGS